MILPLPVLFSLHIVMHFENISIPNFCEFARIRHSYRKIATFLRRKSHLKLELLLSGEATAFLGLYACRSKRVMSR
jgi:hypothetical protein